MNVSITNDTEDGVIHLFDLEASLSTDGTGLWSDVAKHVRIYRISHTFYKREDEFYGEMRVYFNLKDWNVVADGLIYTDPLFLRGLRLSFEDMGMSESDSHLVCYSEQGMQTSEYVSLDIGTSFICGLVETLTFNNKIDMYDGLSIFNMENVS